MIAAHARASFLMPALCAVALVACVDDAAPAPSVDASEALPGGDTTNTLLLGTNAFALPASNITVEHEPMFFTGNSFFNQAWVEAPASTANRDGLGPLFNARSCASCHFRDGRGAPPATDDEAFLGVLLRLSVPGVDAHGGPSPDPVYGGQLQPFALPGVPSEGTPRVVFTEQAGTYDDGTAYTLLAPTYAIDELGYGPLADDIMISPRVAPQMIGLGLLEAIPDDRLLVLADPDDADGDGISGRPNRVWDVEANALRIGRFGWKSDQPSVRQQVAGAFLGDMGITTPVFPAQNCSAAQPDCASAPNGDGDGEPEIREDLLHRVVVYSSLLAVPARRAPDDAEVLRGRALFADAGCASCHTPSHQTGPHALPEVAHQTIWPYTDLLLHDMGPALADDRPVFEATGREWRTPPLWGIGLLPSVNAHQRLLHDGRARGVAEAVLWHGGEAEAARDAFRAMTSEQRDALVHFVESL